MEDWPERCSSYGGTLDSGVPRGCKNPGGRSEEEFASEKAWRFLPNRLGYKAGSTKEQLSRMEKGLEASRVGVGILIRISDITS